MRTWRLRLPVPIKVLVTFVLVGPLIGGLVVFGVLAASDMVLTFNGSARRLPSLNFEEVLLPFIGGGYVVGGIPALLCGLWMTIFVDEGGRPGYLHAGLTGVVASLCIPLALLHGRDYTVERLASTLEAVVVLGVMPGLFAAIGSLWLAKRWVGDGLRTVKD